jgi:hypothetical protein
LRFIGAILQKSCVLPCDRPLLAAEASGQYVSCHSWAISAWDPVRQARPGCGSPDRVVRVEELAGTTGSRDSGADRSRITGGSGEESRTAAHGVQFDGAGVTERRHAAAALRPQEAITVMNEVKRTTPPETKNGTQWEIRLSAVPSREWLELFKVAGSSAGIAAPQRVVFDRDTAYFKSDEQHVEQWIRSLDTWIAATNARRTASLEQAGRERATREDAETKERERIRQMNERFKGL